jgi:AcrR family transcriptional regulator
MNHHLTPLFPKPAAPSTSRARAKQRTRQRLLGAARRLFMSRGYEAATIRDIASEADLSTGAVFASFADKAELFNEVIVADCEALVQQMASAPDTGSAPETLLNLLSIGYSRHFAELPLTRAAIGFSWVRGEEHEARYRRVRVLVLNQLGDVLRRGVARGELSSDLDVTLTSEMLLDCYFANFRRAIFDGWDLETLRARLESQIVVLLAGYRAAA